MHRKLLIGLCAVFIISNSIADETKQTADTKTPASPVMPVVSDPADKHAGKNNERSQKTPNTAENPFSTRNPFVRPAFPPPFSPNTMQSPANNETVHEIANYTMTVTAAYPNGDTKKSTADTINYAQCIVYSDNAITLKLFFTDGTRRTYYLKNPRVKIQTSPGIYRTRYDTLIQTENTMLLDSYTSETYSDETSIKSITIMDSNTVVVAMNFVKRGYLPGKP